MLTLDSITFFFYSWIISTEPPSKKRKASCDPISTWIDNIHPNVPPPSKADSSWTGKPPPSLTLGSTWSSLNSALTNNIWLTQKIQLPTGVRKGLKKPYIEVEENGIYSDYDEMTGQEWDKVVTSPLKHSAHATSSVSLTCISNIIFTRTLSPKTNQSPSPLPKHQRISRNPTFLMGLTLKYFAAPSFLPSSHTTLARGTHGTDNHPPYAARSILSWSRQVEWTLKSTPKGPSIKM